MDHSFMVFYRQSSPFYVVSSTLFHDTCTVDESIWHKCLGMPFAECRDNPVHWLGADKNPPAVKPENVVYPDPSADNTIMVHQRYGFYV